MLGSVFWRTKIEKIALPKMLKEVGKYLFYDCKRLKTVYVEKGCEASLRHADVPYSAKVGPPPETMLGSARIWDLKELKDIVIPDGVEKIENYWFWGAEVERITISASVKEICTSAFYECGKLSEVVFEEGSKLKVIGEGAFENCSNIRSI